MSFLLLLLAVFELLLVQPRELGKRFELDRLDEYLAGAVRNAKSGRSNERRCASAARKPKRAVTNLLLRLAAPYAPSRVIASRMPLRLPSTARLSEYVEEDIDNTMDKIRKMAAEEEEDDDDEYWADFPEVANNISVAEAWEMLQESEDSESKPVLLDLRSRRSHCIQRPAGALSQTAGLSSRLGLVFQFDENFVNDVGSRFAFDQPLLLFHRLSRNAAELLESAGHTAVYAIDGGIGAWKKAGLPIDRGLPDGLAWEEFDPEDEELYLDPCLKAGGEEEDNEEDEEDEEEIGKDDELSLDFDSLYLMDEHQNSEEQLENHDETKLEEEEEEAPLLEHEEGEDFDSLTVPILKDKLRALGLKVSGKKGDLVDRLKEAQR